MDPMLTPPRRRPRPPSWRIPLLVAVALAFLLALWAVAPASSAMLPGTGGELAGGAGGSGSGAVPEAQGP